MLATKKITCFKILSHVIVLFFEDDRIQIERHLFHKLKRCIDAHSINRSRDMTGITAVNTKIYNFIKFVLYNKDIDDFFNTTQHIGKPVPLAPN
jgi:hypothetical protein